MCEMHRRLHEMVAAPVIRGQEFRSTSGISRMRSRSSPTSRGWRAAMSRYGSPAPGTLRITVRKKEEEREGYAVRERLSGEMTRVVNLPAEVTEEGAAAALRNGVLAVRLKKVPGQGVEIPIREE